MKRQKYYRIWCKKSLNSSGQLSYISNRSLASLISSFEDEITFAIEGQPAIERMFNDKVFPLAIKYTSMCHEKDGRGICMANWNRFYNDKILSSHLEHCYRWRRSLVNVEESLLVYLEQLIGLIEEETNDFSN